eukprot:gb/GEZJ01002436.1/.p3 GENE.gb/GEZJ01002436.1/~~gb/GEZJ01002436.1/.p3  ORF type:complete len:127 (+),score=16.78 gb/GEZJ01002436.1/:659-1039(+)
MLSEETLTNAKLQLVSLAEARQKSEPKDEVCITKNCNTSVLEFIDQLSESFNSDDAMPNTFDNANTVRRKATDIVNSTRELLQERSELFQYLKRISQKAGADRKLFYDCGSKRTSGVALTASLPDT